MQNVISFNFKKGAVDLVSRTNSGTNELRIRVIDGKGARIRRNGTDMATVMSNDFEYVFDSSLWVGEGVLVFQIATIAYEAEFTISKVDSLEGDTFINQISDFSFELVRKTAPTASYDNLTNKPKIEGVTLQGNKTAEQLGLMPSDADHVTHAELTAGLATKQNTLTAGDNISIEGNTISAEIEANPSATPSAILNTIRIGGVVFSVPSGDATTTTNANITILSSYTSVGEEGSVEE
jgi:hypothetical protein